MAGSWSPAIPTTYPSRAVSVVHELIDEAGIEPTRIGVEGRADTQPLAPNDSAANRARNRRVEIMLIQGDDLMPDNEVSLSQWEPPAAKSVSVPPRETRPEAPQEPPADSSVSAPVVDDGFVRVPAKP